MPQPVGPAPPRIARALRRWGAKTRRVLLELGRQQIASWDHDGNDAHAMELAHTIAELATDTAQELERDCSFQLSAFDEHDKPLGSAPLKILCPETESARSDAEGPAQKHAAMLLRHNEQLQQRLLALTEQQSQGLSRALDAQGKVLEALASRLATAEQALSRSTERETEAQHVAREALALVETAMAQAPNAGFKQTLEKVGALIELAGKGRELLDAQQALDAVAGVAGKLNGTATPPAASPFAASSDGGGT